LLSRILRRLEQLDKSYERFYEKHKDVIEPLISGLYGMILLAGILMLYSVLKALSVPGDYFAYQLMAKYGPIDTKELGYIIDTFRAIYAMVGFMLLASAWFIGFAASYFLKKAYEACRKRRERICLP